MVNTVKGAKVNTAKPKAVVNAARPKAVLNAIKGNHVNAVKASTCWVWKPKTKVINHVPKHNSASMLFKRFDYGNPQQDLKEKGVINSGCSRHMTGNMSYLTDFEEIDRGYVAFGVPRKDNMYSVDLKNIVPKGGLTCLFAKATSDETKLWHRRLGHINFKTMNKLVKGNLVIRCDNGTEFKNKDMNQFCERKSIKREFSVARTPQQNGVAERKNRTLIEAARTMLADFKLPTTFWVEAVNTDCHVQNRVLVTKPHNKTPYELFPGRKPALGFMKPFGCPVIILNTIDHLGKFDGKVDEGFFVGYSVNSKAFRLFNSRTRIVEENLHVQFSENTPNVAGSTKVCDDAGKARMETILGKDYILLPLWTADSPFSQSLKISPDVGFKPSSDDENPRKDSEFNDQEKEDSDNSTNNVNVASTNEVNAVGVKTSIDLPDDPNMLELEDIVYSDDNEDVGAKKIK
ncbi:ribonuclease H-like domain-containing protein [Tanacetum coccineum]